MVPLTAVPRATAARAIPPPTTAKINAYSAADAPASQARNSIIRRRINSPSQGGRAAEIRRPVPSAYAVVQAEPWEMQVLAEFIELLIV